MIRTIFHRKFAAWTVPLGLLVVCLLGFGVMLPRLGFYWDDWSKILVSRIWGLDGYWRYYAEDRPLSSWTHILLTPILGNTPLAWHILALFLRWFSACAMWWCLRSLWQGAGRQAAFAAFLFLVYPVFTQQAIAVTFHQQWMQYAFFFLSLGFMIEAYRQSGRFWIFTILALLTLILELSITEYFVGLELIRPVVLWFLLINISPVHRPRWNPLIRAYGPYLVIFGSFVLWRLFFIQLPGEDPYSASTLYNLASAPLSSLVDLTKVIFTDSFYVFITSWAQVLDIGLQGVAPRFTLFAWLAGALAAVLVGIFLFKLDEPDSGEENGQRVWLRQALVLGFLGMLFGCIPAWVTGRRVIEDFHANRYALPAMFGGSLATVALIEWISQRRLQKSAFLGLLIGLAVIFQLRTADWYRQVWNNQISFAWQLYWRAPYIEPSTAIFSEDELFPNQGRFSTSASLNLLYPQAEEKPESLAYWNYGFRPKLTYAAANPFDILLYTQFRSLIFKGTTSQALIVQFDPQRADCLWVLDPVRDVDNPDLPALTRDLLPLSRLDRIQPLPLSKNYPPVELFGNQPAPDWCFYFETADLARQVGDWKRVVELGDEARESGYRPDDGRYMPPQEWLPFIEGYAQTGRWEDARDLTLASAYVEVFKYGPRFCSQWERILGDTPTGEKREAVTREIFSELSCNP